MKRIRRKSIDELFQNDSLITRALRRAVREAILDHKRAGNPICVWRDGRTVWIQPKDIPG